MPFNPRFTITPKINKALVEIERAWVFLRLLNSNAQTAAELETRMPAKLDKVFKGESCR